MRRGLINHPLTGEEGQAADASLPEFRNSGMHLLSFV